MQLEMRDFWPLWGGDQTRKITYKDASGNLSMTSLFRHLQPTGGAMLGTMTYENYGPKGEWLNTWYYRYLPGFGVSEWRDDYPPADRFPDKWLLGGRGVVMMGTPIGWGDQITVGGSYTNHPTIDGLKCWFPRRNNKGFQHVVFEDYTATYVTPLGHKYYDTLQLACVQNWNNETPTFIRYWFAKNVGPVAIQFHQWNGTGFDAMPLVYASKVYNQ